jgi:hypothetical protein
MVWVYKASRLKMIPSDVNGMRHFSKATDSRLCPSDSQATINDYSASIVDHCVHSMPRILSALGNTSGY